MRICNIILLSTRFPKRKRKTGLGTLPKKSLMLFHHGPKTAELVMLAAPASKCLKFIVAGITGGMSDGRTQRFRGVEGLIINSWSGLRRSIGSGREGFTRRGGNRCHIRNTSPQNGLIPSTAMPMRLRRVRCGRVRIIRVGILALMVMSILVKTKLCFMAGSSLIVGGSRNAALLSRKCLVFSLPMFIASNTRHCYH